MTVANTSNISTIQILRSYANSVPTTLQDGQLAFSFKSNTKTEFEFTCFGSSLDKVAAIPIMMKSPINEKMIKDNKLAKTILKKLFMYMIEVKKHSVKIGLPKIG